jgi:protein TonB
VPGGTGVVAKTVQAAPRPMYLSPEMSRPRRISGEQPGYTDQARRARVEGDVTVRIEIGPDGRVVEVRVLSGLALLDQEVVSKIRDWRFTPPTYRGQPVSVYLIQRITFRLED